MKPLGRLLSVVLFALLGLSCELPLTGSHAEGARGVEIVVERPELHAEEEVAGRRTVYTATMSSVGFRSASPKNRSSPRSMPKVRCTTPRFSR